VSFSWLRMLWSDQGVIRRALKWARGFFRSAVSRKGVDHARRFPQLVAAVAALVATRSAATRAVEWIRHPNPEAVASRRH